MMNAVGGTSLHYWAQSWRLHPWDFNSVIKFFVLDVLPN
jgi:hypothetical protein